MGAPAGGGERQAGPTRLQEGSISRREQHRSPFGAAPALTSTCPPIPNGSHAHSRGQGVGMGHAPGAGNPVQHEGAHPQASLKKKLRGAL